MSELQLMGEPKNYKKLTALGIEEQKQLKKIRLKWQKIARSTDRVNRGRAEKTINAIYAYANKTKPEIIFVDSPHLPMIARFAAQTTLYSPSYLLRKLRRQLNKAFRAKVARSLRQELHDYFLYPSLSEFSDVLYKALAQEMGQEEPIAKLELGVYAYYDFARKLVDYQECDLEWKLLQTWAKEGQWSFTFDGLCIICDRPAEILIPKSKKLSTSTLNFSDGVSFSNCKS